MTEHVAHLHRVHRVGVDAGRQLLHEGLAQEGDADPGEMKIDKICGDGVLDFLHKMCEIERARIAFFVCCCRVFRMIVRLEVGDCSVPRSEGCAPNDMVQTRGASVLFVCVRRVKKVCDYTEMKKNTIREVDNFLDLVVRALIKDR